MKKSIAETITSLRTRELRKPLSVMRSWKPVLRLEIRSIRQQTENYDALVNEIKSIDAHLVRLRELEESNKQKAVPIKVVDPVDATQTRAVNGSSYPRVTVKQREVEPWVPFIRLVKAKMWSRIDNISAHEIASANPQWMAETPEVAQVLKAPVPVGNTTDTTWAAPLVNYQILVESVRRVPCVL